MVGVLLAFIACVAKPVPFALVGVWDVVRVSPDQVDQPAWLYRPDEPALVGRELSITSSALSFNYDVCDKPRWTMKVSTWKTLLRRSFRRSPKYGRPRVPSPEDFDLKEAASKPLRALSVACKADEPNSQWSRTWFVVEGPNKMLMSFGQMVILSLERRPPDAKPKASFDCSKATTKTERAICASFQLAAWDRSVAAAWKWRSQITEDDDQQRFKAEQNGWLKKRDVCGADAQCLTDSMEERTGELR